MVFTGTYEHAIDAKSRLAIPAEVRDLLAETHPDVKTIFLYVTPGEQRSLCLYTQAGFEQRATELDRSELDIDELLERERLMFALARRVEIDNQGRIRLPEQLLKITDLGTEVVLIGVKDHLEIRNREAWNAHVQEKLADPNMFSNPRRMMHKPAPARETNKDQSSPT